MSLPNLNLWQTEAVRVTFIAQEPISAQVSDWWKILTGVSPETIVTKPNLAFQSTSGEFINGSLELRITSNRVDLIYTPVMHQLQSIPSLGDARDVFKTLREPLNKWLHSSREINFVRVAYAPVFFILVGDINEANSVVSNYFKFVGIELSLAQDLLFQINIPKKLNCLKDYSFNRIGKFMSGTGQVISFGESSPVPIMEDHYFCRVEIDFNTNATRTDKILGDDLILIVDELATESICLMDNGWNND